jgi:hypothetical protein
LQAPSIENQHKPERSKKAAQTSQPQKNHEKKQPYQTPFAKRARQLQKPRMPYKKHLKGNLVKNKRV